MQEQLEPLLPQPHKLKEAGIQDVTVTSHFTRRTLDQDVLNAQHQEESDRSFNLMDQMPGNSVRERLLD
jgi:hypothetical protein